MNRVGTKYAYDREEYDFFNHIIHGLHFLLGIHVDFEKVKIKGWIYFPKTTSKNTSRITIDNPPGD